MRDFLIYSYKYNIDLSKLAKKHMEQESLEYKVIDKNSIMVLSGDEEKLAAAICNLILYDLMPFEMADILSTFSLEHTERQQLYRRSVKLAYTASMRQPVYNRLLEYINENESLTLEGFITFRMSETREIWERCAEKTIDDSIYEVEQEQLVDFLCEIIGISEPFVITIIVREDGTCTFTDDTNKSVEFSPAGYQGAINLLLSLNPDQVVICDLTNKPKNEFVSTVRQMFDGRTSIYTPKR